MKTTVLVLLAGLTMYGPAISGETDIDKKGACIDSIRVVCHITGSSARLAVFQRTTVLNAKGKEYGGLYISQSPNIQIKKYEAEVYGANQKELASYNLSDLNKICGYGSHFQLYSDLCRYSMDIALPQYPYFIEEKYELYLKSLFFWNGYDFQYSIPVRQASYELIVPDDFQFRYKTYGIMKGPQIDTLSKQVKYLWSATDIPAETDEDYVADCYPPLARLSFVAGEIILEKYHFTSGSWRDIGRWFAQLSEDCYPKAAGSDVGAESGTAWQMSMVKELYDEIISDFRYVSVSVGISGWRPNPAELVAQRKFGDCKDLAVLLVSRLRGLGIRTFPCLALTRGMGEVDTAFPKDNFNHVFVAALIGQDTIWMDPTCSKCPFGELPDQDENIPVLMITDSGGVLVQTPSSSSEMNRAMINSTITLRPDGTYRFASNIEYRGNLGHYARSRLDGLDRDEIRSYFENWPIGGSRQFNITGYDYNRDLSPYSPVIMELQGVSRKPTERLGQVYYINPNLYGFGRYLESLELNKRTTPLDNDFPYSRIHEVTFKWDSSLSVDSLVVPTDEDLEYEFARLKLTYSRGQGEARAVLHTEIKDYFIGVDKMPELAEFRSRCLNLLSRPVKYFISGQ